MTLDDLRANPQHYLLSPLPTPVLVRLYRKWSRLEVAIGSIPPAQRDAMYGGEGKGSDAYDKVADRAAAASWILRERGVDLCLYCGTTDGSHRRGVACPANLAGRFGIPW